MTSDTDFQQGFTLSDMFRSLWRWRGWIVSTPILFAGIAVLLAVIFSLIESRHVTYIVSLRNIENQKYPNGAVFSPRDLLIPEVLAELRRRFEIAPDVNMSEAILVTYDSPLAEGIARRYQQRLSARNLSQAEIEALNQSFLEQLQNVMRSSLRINVDYRALGVSSATGLAIAAALPQVWTEIYTTKFRIFMDKGVSEFAITRTQEDLLTPASVMVASQRLASMQRGLETFLDDNRLSMLRVGDGVSPADLLVELTDFQAIYFNSIKVMALHANDPSATSYIDQLRINISEKKRQIEAFDSTLAALNTYQRSGQPIQAGQPPVPGEPPNTIQLGDSAFAGIIELAQRGSQVAFVQRTLDDRRTLMIELSALEKEWDFVQAEAENRFVSTEVRSQSVEKLKDLTDKYSQMIRAAETLLRDRAGELSEPLLGPRIVGGNLISMTNVLIIAAAALAGLLLSIIGALVAGGFLRQDPDTRIA